MSDKKEPLPRLTMGNTKKEMLDAYQSVVASLKEERKNKIKPEKIVEEKKINKVIETADILSSEGTKLKSLCDAVKL